MVTAAPALEDKVYLDWFKAHSQASLRQYLISSSASASDLLEFLNPFGTSYHSALNPIFLAECESLQQLDFAKTWLARDGLVPLVWFFSRFPEPRGFKGRIYVPADMAQAVPPAWAARVGTYQYGELPRSHLPANYSEYRLPRTKLILLGISSPAYCGLPQLRELLAQSRKRFKAKFGNYPREVSACLIQKTEPLGTAEEASRHANEAMLSICREFGTDVRVSDLREFQSSSSFNGTAVLDLNERLLCADSALVQLAVGKGAALLDPLVDKASDRVLRTNLSHGFAIREPGNLAQPPESTKKFLEKLEWTMTSAANRNFPWHYWSEREITESIERSTLTGHPRILKAAHQNYWVSPQAGSGALEVIYFGADKLEVHGWCVDSVTDRVPSEIHVYRNLKRLMGKTDRIPRADVQRDLKRKFNESFKPGFVFRLPRINLVEPRISDVFSVFCVFGNGLSVLLGEFRLDKHQSQALPLPRGTELIGSYLACRLTKSALELRPGGEGSRPAEYVLTEANEQYNAWLDIAQVEKGEIVLGGWGADFERRCPAEAVVVFGGDKHALVFPVCNRRPDIAATVSRSETSGFKFRAPWVRPRVFVLFDSHVAIEVSVPSKSGSC